jgi:hypothetical protein
VLTVDPQYCLNKYMSGGLHRVVRSVSTLLG